MSEISRLSCRYMSLIFFLAVPPYESVHQVFSSTWSHIDSLKVDMGPPSLRWQPKSQQEGRSLISQKAKPLLISSDETDSLCGQGNEKSVTTGFAVDLSKGVPEYAKKAKKRLVKLHRTGIDVILENFPKHVFDEDDEFVSHLRARQMVEECDE